MGSAFVVLAVAFLFGGMFLILAAGYQDSERERARQAAARKAEVAARESAFVAVPSFFARPEGGVVPLNFVFDETLVNRLERHVQLEQASVAQFVHHPSIDNLYQERGTPLHVH